MQTKHILAGMLTAGFWSIAASASQAETAASPLAGLDAVPMTAEEMDAIQGKAIYHIEVWQNYWLW